MRPEPGQVLHFSEDPTIERFVPHVAPTSQLREPYVWAVTADRCPDYWFPGLPASHGLEEAGTTAADAERIIGAGWAIGCTRSSTAGSGRSWTSVFTRTGCPPSPFAPVGDFEHAVVARVPVKPLGPAEPVRDLLDLHEEAGIQLRVLDNLWPFWGQVTASTLELQRDPAAERSSMSAASSAADIEPGGSSLARVAVGLALEHLVGRGGDPDARGRAARSRR